MSRGMDTFSCPVPLEHAVKDMLDVLPDSIAIRAQMNRPFTPEVIDKLRLGATSVNHWAKSTSISVICSTFFCLFAILFSPFNRQALAPPYFFRARHARGDGQTHQIILQPPFCFCQYTHIHIFFLTLRPTKCIISWRLRTHTLEVTHINKQKFLCRAGKAADLYVRRGQADRPCNVRQNV